MPRRGVLPSSKGGAFPELQPLLDKTPIVAKFLEMLIVYAYHGCATCRNALKFLRSRGVGFEERAIRGTPPTVEELRVALRVVHGDVRKLCNTSGQDYRSLGWKDKLPGLTPEEVLKALASNGNLIKRPLALDLDRGLGLVGFKEDQWRRYFT